MADRIADPTGLAAKVVGVRDLWARFERAGTADRRRDREGRKKNEGGG